MSNTGYVTNVNNSGTFHNVYITVEADGVSVQCIVRALAGDTPVHSTPPPSNTLTSAATIITSEHRKVIRRGQLTGGRSNPPPCLGASRCPRPR